MDPMFQLRYYSVFDKTLKSSPRRGIVDDVDVCAMMVQSSLCLKTGARNRGLDLVLSAQIINGFYPQIS